MNARFSAASMLACRKQLSDRPGHRERSLVPPTRLSSSFLHPDPLPNSPLPRPRHELEPALNTSRAWMRSYSYSLRGVLFRARLFVCLRLSRCRDHSPNDIDEDGFHRDSRSEESHHHQGCQHARPHLAAVACVHLESVYCVARSLPHYRQKFFEGRVGEGQKNVTLPRRLSLACPPASRIRR